MDSADSRANRPAQTPALPLPSWVVVSISVYCLGSQILHLCNGSDTCLLTRPSLRYMSFNCKDTSHPLLSCSSADTSPAPTTTARPASPFTNNQLWKAPLLADSPHGAEKDGLWPLFTPSSLPFSAPSLCAYLLANLQITLRRHFLWGASLAPCALLLFPISAISGGAPVFS